ncbi:MAG: TrbI/VirB10 family protein, partial [Delftia acidovorans]|nr:TrbI/VirB10 family protein [Delftia acidovorans]
SKSEGLDGLPSDYSKLRKVPELGPPLPGDLGPAIVASQQPAVAAYAAPGHDPNDALRKEAEAAAASSVFFRSGGQGQGQAATVAQAAPGAPGAASALAAFDPLAAGPASTAAQPADPTATQNRQDQKEAFLKGGSTETRNSGNLALPASPYQVMAGTVIAGALVTGIKSDLPGDVIATVTEPVYDTATGKFLLIPQGSRILGRYNSQVSYGQSRVQVVWNRVILPDTSSLTLDNLVGTDPAGYAGLEDDVDWHWNRVFAGAVLTTLLGVGAELAAPENRQDGNRIVIAGRDSAQDSINQVGQEITRRNMNIQPTLTARPGLPVRVIVARDLVLRPYQPMFYQLGGAR